jgi:hypothetical protein
MSVIELNPPPLRSARVKRIPSGVQIDAPERAVRLRLPKNATSLDLLRAIYRHPRMPIPIRMEAAQMALPYEHPRLVMIAPSNVDPRQLNIAITGGLPRLPGTNTVFPHGAPPEPPMPEPSVAPDRSPAAMSRDKAW